MGWAKLDDQFFDHPKARAAGKDGRELFVAGLCYSAGMLTDGHIPATALALVAAKAEVKPTVSKLLVAVGLWLPHPTGGYQINDYSDWNPSAEEAREKKRKRAEAGRLGGKRSGYTRRTKSEAKPEANASAVASPVASPASEAKAKQKRTPSPSPSPSPANASTSSDAREEPVVFVNGATDDDEEPEVIARTWPLLAERSLDRRNSEVQARGHEPITGARRRQAWILEDVRRSREVFGTLARSYLEADPGLDPGRLVELLEDPIAGSLSSSPIVGRGR